MGFSDKYKKPGKWLKKDAFKPNQGVNLTIKSWGEHDWEDGDPPQLVLYWTTDKYPPLVCNPTNVFLVESVTGADTEDELIGHTIHVFHDPTVTFGNKRGGIRICAKKERPKQQSVPHAAAPPPPAEPDPTVEDDDIPF